MMLPASGARLSTRKAEIRSIASLPEAAVTRGESNYRPLEPVLAELQVPLNHLAESAHPKSKLGKALTTALTTAQYQLTTPRRDTQDGRMTIDNNFCEHASRHQAIGRKNRVFFGGSAAGERPRCTPCLPSSLG